MREYLYARYLRGVIISTAFDTDIVHGSHVQFRDFKKFVFMEARCRAGCESLTCVLINFYQEFMAPRMGISGGAGDGGTAKPDGGVTNVRFDCNAAR